MHTPKGVPTAFVDLPPGPLAARPQLAAPPGVGTLALRRGNCSAAHETRSESLRGTAGVGHGRGALRPEPRQGLRGPADRVSCPRSLAGRQRPRAWRGAAEPSSRCNLPDGHAIRPRPFPAPRATRRTKLHESAGTTVADIWEETVDRWTMKEAIVQGDISLSFSVADEGAASWEACIPPQYVGMRTQHAGRICVAGLRAPPGLVLASVRRQ